MALRLADGTAWSDVLARAVAATGEAFGAEVDGVTTLHNLVEGEWRATGQPAPVRTPVDNTVVINLRRLDADTARAAVLHAAAEHRTWARTPLADRKARVADALDSLTAHRDLLAMLLVWEIGKPWRLACADVDRALDGVRWYADEIDRMLMRRSRAAARPGQQHRVVELPDERPRARRAGAAAGRQRGHRQDPVPGRRRLPDRRTRADAPRRPARDPRQRRWRGVVRGAGSRTRDRCRRVRRRTLQRRQGRGRAARHRQAALHRAGGPQRLGHLELLPVGPARRPPEEGLRVRQAALHRVPPVRGAT